MDIKNFSSGPGLKSGQSQAEPTVRTMAKDLEALSKTGLTGLNQTGAVPKPSELKPIQPAPPAPLKQAAPPLDLPVLEVAPAKPVETSSPQPVKPAPTEQPAVQPPRPKTEPDAEEKQRLADLEAKIKAAWARKKEPANRPLAEIKPSQKPGPVLTSAKEPALKKPLPSFLLWISGLVIVLVLAAGFIYWWKYLKPAPEVITHYQCQENKCVSVEGEGQDACRLDADCGIILLVPESLIPVDQDKTIELAGIEENQLFDKLKEIDMSGTATGTVWRLLVKSENDYLDLAGLKADLGLVIPEQISSKIATSTDNYTLFLYHQGAGSEQLGLVIALTPGADISQDLTLWEQAIVNDLAPLFLGQDISQSATPGFQDGNYQNTALRYRNFTTADVALDYSAINNKLLITTSKDSMFKAMEKLILP